MHIGKGSLGVSILKSLKKSWDQKFEHLPLRCWAIAVNQERQKSGCWLQTGDNDSTLGVKSLHLSFPKCKIRGTCGCTNLIVLNFFF